MTASVVYRGPLERSRLRLLLRASAAAHGPVHFRWVHPGPVGRRSLDVFLRFLEHLGDSVVVDGTVYPGSLTDVASTHRSLRAIVEDIVLAVGFSVREFIPGGAEYIWSINGVPEEQLLHGHSARAQAMVRAAWGLKRLRRAQVKGVITVSKRMSQLVNSQVGELPFLEVPMTVDTELFRPPAASSGEPCAVYVGTGAPWQNLEEIGQVWRAIAERAADVTFLVISRDPRTRALIEAVPKARAQMWGSDDPRAVAAAVGGGTIGFLLRSDTLVNQVSYPTKFGEYAACGVVPIVSDIDWDLADTCRNLDAGVLVRTGSAGVDDLDRMIERARRPLPARQEECGRIADYLSEHVWVERAALFMRAVAQATR